MTTGAQTDGVRVKALRWVQKPTYREGHIVFHAASVIGEYQAWQIDGYGAWSNDRLLGCYRIGDNVEAAKAAAQADYETRIRSALLPAPATADAGVGVSEELTIADYEEVLADKRRLTRELDVALHGEKGAAKQASLCDLIEPARKLRQQNIALIQEAARADDQFNELDEKYAKAVTELAALRVPAPTGEGVVECEGADDPEERCPRHPRDCVCWKVDLSHPTVRPASALARAGDGWRPKTVYLASRYSRFPEMQKVRSDLEALGYTVTSRWINGGHELTKEGSTEAHEAERVVYAQEDFADLLAAEIVISFTEIPRETKTRGGRHVEHGMALALGKRTIVVGWRENVFHCLPECEFFTNWPDALATLTPPSGKED